MRRTDWKCWEGLTVGESSGERVDAVEDDGACNGRRVSIFGCFSSWRMRVWYLRTGNVEGCHGAGYRKRVSNREHVLRSRSEGCEGALNAPTGVGNFFPRRPAILTDLVFVRGSDEVVYIDVAVAARNPRIRYASTVVRRFNVLASRDRVSPAFHMRLHPTINNKHNHHFTHTNNMSTANTLSSCVSSLRSSMQLLDSSISILDSGTSDFPRLARVLQATRVGISSPFVNFH